LKDSNLVLDEGGKLRPIEIKSSQTFNPHFLDGLSKWSRCAGDSALPAQLVYAGEDSMLRGGVDVQSWRKLACNDHLVCVDSS
jgi:hypothetical protein